MSRVAAAALALMALAGCATDRCESYQTRILYSYGGAGGGGDDPQAPCLERRAACRDRCLSRCVATKQQNGACDDEQSECTNFCEDGLRFCEAKADQQVCLARPDPQP